jgi:integrase
VPSDLVAYLNKSHINKSLKTSDHREAIRRWREQQGEAEIYFDEVRRQVGLVPARNREKETLNLDMLADSHIEGMVLNWYHETLNRDAKTSDCQPDHFAPASVLQEMGTNIQRYRSSNDEVTIDEISRAADAILLHNGAPYELVEIGLGIKQRRLSVNRNGSQYRYLFSLVRRAHVEIETMARSRLLDQTYEPVDPLFATGSPQTSRLRHHTLNELIRDFVDDPLKQANSAKMQQHYTTVFRLLRETLGPRCQLKDIDRKACRGLQKLILRLPPNATKRFPKLSLAEAAAQADKHDLKRLSTNTVNGYLTTVSTLFNWAVREERMPSNPARGLLVGEDKDARREPFSKEQLRLIFGAPLYTGCVDDEHNYAKPGSNRPRRARFWIPLLSLFHGLRLNEACQLGVDDITHIDSIAVIRVREVRPDQSVKSKSGTRDIPIHPTVTELGFLDYVVTVKANDHERLFPELKQDARGYYSDAFQKWFSRFLRSCGADRPKTSFHSFRHAWRDALRRADVPDRRAQALGGWKEGGADAGYGKGEPLYKLALEVAKVEYPGLDLSFLYGDDGVEAKQA